MKLLLMWFGMSAFVGGLSGAAVGALCAARWWQNENQAAAPSEADTDKIDPVDTQKVEAVAEQWASARQVPGFSPYAAGYLRDRLGEQKAMRWWRR